MAVDSVTGLPWSKGIDTILTIVDQFSKLVHYVAFSSLPSARETAGLLIQQVFCIRGIPVDAVSDRSPLVVSQVWRAFFVSP